ncbi:unnamed protein product, partial [Tilletia laevis]
MSSNNSNGESTALFKIPTLTGLDDFFQWKTALTDSLLMLGALDIVEGNEPQPVAIKIEESTTAALTVVSAEEKKDLKSWLERDRKAMAIMRRTISDTLKVDIEDCRSAKEIWDQLCSLHDLTAPEHRAEIKRELLNHFLLEGTDLKAHLDGFLQMLYKASGAGLRYADEDKCLMFLDSLPESFDMLKFQWRMYPESLKTFAELRRQYNLEEAQRARTQARSTAAVMMAAGNKNQEDHSRKSNYTERKGSGHGKGNGRDLSRVRCYRCNELGHMKRDCPKDEDSQEGGDTHMVAPTGPFIGVANAVTVDPAEDATVATVTGPRNTTWIIDSGATHHIVSDASQLTDMRKLHSPMQFGLATRKGSMESTAVGSVGMTTEDGKKVLFTEVHHVKEARVNLLSAPVLIRKGWTVSLKHNESFIRNGTLTLSLAEKQGLFLLELPGAGTDTHHDQQEHLVAFTPAKDEVVTLTEAHERFGHVSKTRLKNMIRDGTIKGIVLKDNVSDFCVSCQKVKTTKHTFGQETLRGTSPLDLVVTDVAGAVQDSASGNKYYVALTDDYLGLTLAKAIPAKHVVAQTVIGWIHLLENCLAAKVHVLRSDGGGEYTSNAFKAWLGGKGIVHQVTPPYTPQHNGIAERKNRTIKEMVSAMMVDSGISMAYWDWALQYTTVIQLILTVRDGISAWERLFKRKVNLRMVQPFGCAAWVHTPAETRTKSDLTAAKTIRGRYLGLTYEGGVAVLENGTGKIHVTREVTFEPRHQSATITEIPDPTPSQDGPVPTPASTTVEEPHLHDVTGNTDESGVGQGESVEKFDEGSAEQGEDAAKAAKEVKEVLETGVEEPEVADVEDKGTAVAEDQGEQEAGVGQHDVPGDRNEDTGPADRKRARQDEVAVGTGQARARPMHVPEPRRPRPEVPRRALPPRRAAPGRNGNVNIAAAELGDEPNTHRQAMAAPDASEWQAAEAVELGNHRRAGTWKPAKLPVGRTAVGSRWVYKRKRNSEG